MSMRLYEIAVMSAVEPDYINKEIEMSRQEALPQYP
jgi:hypothetical protein